MKKLFILLITTGLLVSCEDFLDVPPATGLTSDKLTDLAAMESLVMGAYDNARLSIPQVCIYTNVQIRDLKTDQVNHTQFWEHNPTETLTEWYFSESYICIDLLNKVLNADVEDMEGTDAEKAAILGDAYFLRALIYYDLAPPWTLHSTGYTVPYIDELVDVNERVSCSLASEIRTAVEADIEEARTKFTGGVSGNADYWAATALAARIYFHHGKYDQSYQMANEVITNGGFSLPPTVTEAFQPETNSAENIFSLKYNATEANLAIGRLYSQFVNDIDFNVFWLNPDGEAVQIFLSVPGDARWDAFVADSSASVGRMYISEKYPTDQMNYPLLRLPEMYLTRAEANIMRNSSVSQQDVDDINMLRNRANPSTMLGAIPSVDAALDTLYNDRVREMLIDGADRFHNIYRLQRPIVKIPQEGSGWKPFSEYADQVAWPLPQREVDFHGLTRNP